MDELLDGLDCKLRVSGMVADSIMMGIVYSAMEGAFEKACSKEGVIERLNEKSRFCELAVMQLEWGLKFVQEETDISFVVESSYEREKLISDLKEVRDRMQMRLEETEFAISRKDRELAERIEIELKLRQALEVKDKELWSLHTNLELERTKSEGIQEQISDQKKIQESVIGNLVSVDESIDGDFCELKNSVDQQFLNIKQKLEDERINITSGMRKMSQGASSKSNFEHDSQLVEDEENYNDDTKENEVQENGCEVEPPKSTLKPEVNAGFHKMGSDIDVLKETLDIAFGMMDNAISLSEVRPMEQQWRWTLEKDTISVVFKGFLRDMQDNFEAKMRKGKRQGSVVQFENWSELMDEITNLRQELEQLVDHVKNFSGPVSPPSQKESPLSQKDVGGNPFSQRTSKSRGKPPLGASFAPEKNENLDNTSSKTIETNLEEERPKEDSGGQGSLVAEMVRNHESIIRQKSAERNWLRGEILREKGYLSSKKDKEPDTLKKRIQDIILRLDNVIQWNGNMDGDYDDGRCGLGNDSGDENLTEEIEQMKQEREDSYLESAILDEVYATLFKFFIKEHHLELDNYVAENLIRADVSKVFFGEKVKEWKDDIESYALTEHQVKGNEEDLMKDSQLSDTSSQNLEGLIREDVCTVFLREMVKEWNEGMEIHNIESHIREEIYHIVLCKAAKDTYGFTSTDCQVGRRENNFVEGSPSSNKSVENLEGLIREDIYTVYLLELFKEWNQAIESNNVENHIRENVFQIVFHESMKYTDCSRNFTAAGCPGGIGEGLEGLTREAACTFLLKDMVKESEKALKTIKKKKKEKALKSYKSETLVGEEIYEAVFEEFIKDMDAALRLTLVECHEAVNIKEALPFTNKLFQSLESLLREDVCNVFFREMVKEWKKEVESYNIETLISEEINQLVILEAVKDTNECLTKYQEDINPDCSQEDLPSTNTLSKSPEFYENETLIQKLDSLSKCFQLEEDLMISARCELMDQNLHIVHMGLEHEKLGLYIDSNILIQRDETLASVRNKLEKTLQQISWSKTHLHELSSSLDMTGGVMGRVNDQMTPIQATAQDIKYPCFTEVNEAVQISHVLPFAEFSKSMIDFENMAEQKKGKNVSRWEEVKHQSELPIELVTSLSKKESLYREAFYRRCYDLQKAETEVDLLGDENEALVGLLEKIHTLLDHYSPVLQHYFGIMEILKLIRKALNAPALVHPVSNINSGLNKEN